MLHWLRHYRRDWLAGDIGAGVVVAMMMIPQGLAYALVAGLPPVTGLYASIVPAICYALIGTSMTQSVGPMAIVSLMTASALAPLAAQGSGLYGVLAGQLAFMVGTVLLLCGLLRVGFLANFFSRPVMSGFTTGATILIAWGQLPALFGAALPGLHWPSAMLGVGALVLLVVLRSGMAPALVRMGVLPSRAAVAAKLAPMFVLLGGMLLVELAGLRELGVATAGDVPGGLPGLNLATSHSHWGALLQPALLIAFIVFLVSMSGAQVLAQKRQEKLDSNRELLALGAANVGSALSGGFPVTGSLSRSAVNFAAGAATPLASTLSAVLIAAALVAPTGWLSLLPLPVLAATIIVAVVQLMEFDTLRTAWRYDRSDALALLATLAGVLAAGIQEGVVIGVVLSMGTLIWRASRPHIAVLGRIAGTEHFRNIERYPAETVPGLLIMRIDANLFFGNVEAVSARMEEEIASRPGTRDLVLVMSAVNSIDTTALLGLAEWNETLDRRGIRLHLAEVKGPVMDRLKTSDVGSRLTGNIYLSTAMASDELARG
ncbi:SulP family inorganic anion transporter [Pseudoduganella sp. GCM10020061]|uniref:SulP family inorganic anion transporter n=1 Tax=Pseudoduganella sp. GCM10020061 TaxID=3317345 RepID=UPI003645506B